MPPERPREKSRFPDYDFLVTDDGSLSLIEVASQAAFHSGSGAASETFHVYARPLLERLAEWELQRPFRVLEYGFGTGLGWLTTACLAKKWKKSLAYVGLEKNLLPVELLRALQPIQGMKQAIEKGWIPPIGEDVEAISLATWDAIERHQAAQPNANLVHQLEKGLSLEIVVVDATTYELRATDLPFDAIYFDPFAPDVSPQLWEESVLQAAYRSLQPGGILMTYCVARDIRERFERIGFQVSRIPGPPHGKRQVLLATKPL